MKNTRVSLLLGGILLLLGLAACGSATPATPTQSPDAIYTEVASTIQAAVDQTAAAMPTGTSTPEAIPTEIPSPTLPALPTEEGTSEENPVDSPVSTTNPIAPPVSTTAPIATEIPVVPTTGGNQSGDHATFGYQSPADHGTFGKSEEVKLTWGLVNTGTTTWSAKCYTLREFGGTSIQAQTTYAIDSDVKPGSKAEFNIAAFMPTKAGEYISRWGLYNCSNQRFYEVYFAFNIQ